MFFYARCKGRKMRRRKWCVSTQRLVQGTRGIILADSVTARGFTWLALSLHSVHNPIYARCGMRGGKVRQHQILPIRICIQIQKPSWWYTHCKDGTLPFGRKHESQIGLFALCPGQWLQSDEESKIWVTYFFSSSFLFPLIIYLFSCSGSGPLLSAKNTDQDIDPATQETYKLIFTCEISTWLRWGLPKICMKEQDIWHLSDSYRWSDLYGLIVNRNNFRSRPTNKNHPNFSWAPL